MSNTPKKPSIGRPPDSVHEKPSDSDLSARLDDLGTRIDAKLPKYAKADKKDEVSTSKGLAQAFRLSSEFIAGIVVGAGIGFLIDEFAGTSPWGLIVLLLLGFCAGVLNTLRSAGLVAKSNLHIRADTKKERDK